MKPAPPRRRQGDGSRRPSAFTAQSSDPHRCDELPTGVDECVFDYGVNSGVGRAKKVLQRLVGVKDDGALGPLTMAAVARRDPAALINAIESGCVSCARFDLAGVRARLDIARCQGARLRAAARQAGSAVGAGFDHRAGRQGRGAAAAGAQGLRAAWRQDRRRRGTAGGVGAWTWLSAHPLQAGALVVAGIVLIAGRSPRSTPP